MGIDSFWRVGAEGTSAVSPGGGPASLAGGVGPGGAAAAGAAGFSAGAFPTATAEGGFTLAVGLFGFR